MTACVIAQAEMRMTDTLKHLHEKEDTSLDPMQEGPKVCGDHEPLRNKLVMPVAMKTGRQKPLSHATAR